MSEAQQTTSNSEPISCGPAQTYTSAAQLKTNGNFPQLIGDGYVPVDATTVISGAVRS